MHKYLGEKICYGGANKYNKQGHCVYPVFIRDPPIGGCPIVITLSVRLSVNNGHNFFFLYRDLACVFLMTFSTVP